MNIWNVKYFGWIMLYNEVACLSNRNTRKLMKKRKEKNKIG